MPELSNKAIASARKHNEHLLRNEITKLTQTVVADAVDVSDSTITRWLDGSIGIKLPVIMEVLSVTGLKLVSAEEKTISPDRLKYLTEAAIMQMMYEAGL